MIEDLGTVTHHRGAAPSHNAATGSHLLPQHNGAVGVTVERQRTLVPDESLLKLPQSSSDGR